MDYMNITNPILQWASTMLLVAIAIVVHFKFSSCKNCEKCKNDKSCNKSNKINKK